VVIPTLLVLPLASALFSLSRPHVYQGSAEVLLTATSLPAALTGVAANGAGAQPDRIAATQADLARVPEVARRTLAAVGLRGRSPERLLDASSVIPKANTDLLQIDVRDRSSTLADRLANAYANQFTKYKREVDSAGLADALQSVRAEIVSLQRSGVTSGPAYTDLLRAERQLATTAAVGPTKALVVREGGHAQQVEPRPKRALLLGLGLGVVLAVGLAFLLEGLDTRVRNDSEIGQELGLPLLARLPSTPRRERHETRRLRSRSRHADRDAPPVGEPAPAMVVDPQGSLADAIRVLRANVDLVNLERGARLIMVTSAMPYGEQSIVSANLAVAFARAGRHVILVELDLRKPSLARIFGLRPQPGVSDVLLGTARRSRALAEVALGSGATNGTGPPSGNGLAASAGKLEVLVAGQAPPEGREFIGSRGLQEFLVGLGQRADLVVLDAPPMLSNGDAIALGAQAEALIVLVGHEVRKQTLAELRRVLDASPAAKLGVVITGVEALQPHRRRPHVTARGRLGLVATRMEWKHVARAAASTSRVGKRAAAAAASASRTGKRVAGAAATGSVRSVSRLGKPRR
jgi:Mrp family chromosome partitioning ATPase/capsular polysaccharide biosynthesis protein